MEYFFASDPAPLRRSLEHPPTGPQWALVVPSWPLGHIQDRIAYLAQTYPQYPIVIAVGSLSATPVAEWMLWGRVMYESGADAIVESEAAIGSAFGSPTFLQALSDRVVQWVVTRTHLEDVDSTAALVRRFLRAGQQNSRVSVASSGAGTSARLVRDAFRRAGIPNPKEWLILQRALGHGLYMQRAGAAQLLSRTAAELAYPDQSALCRAMRRSFGLTPTEVARVVGLNRLLYEWWMSRVRPS